MVDDRANPAPSAPPVRRHPPTSPGPVERTDEVRVWPNLVGIAVIVLQGLGFLTSIIYAASMLIDYENLLGGIAPAEAFAATAKWKPQLIAAYATAALLSILAIVGGAFVLLRRRIGPRLLLVWSLLRLPYAVWISLLNAISQREAALTVSGITAGSDSRTAFQDVMFWTSFGMSMVFTLALPLFLLIWFHVPKIRRQVRVWR